MRYRSLHVITLTSGALMLAGCGDKPTEPDPNAAEALTAPRGRGGQHLDRSS